MYTETLRTDSRTLRALVRRFFTSDRRRHPNTSSTLTPMSSKPTPVSSSRAVSPPPTKRQRTSGASPQTLAPTLPSRPITDLQTDQLRIFTWNVNGIAPFLQRSIEAFFPASPRKRKLQTADSSDESPSPHRSPSLRDCLRRWKWPHVLCLQEVKIARGDAKTQDLIRRTIQAPTRSAQTPPQPSYSAFFSLPRDKHNARGLGGAGKVYGVCSIVRDDVLASQSTEAEAAEASAVDWDLEGRVLALCLPKSCLLVLNIYAVNGTDHAYRDPRTGAEAGTRHDHKRAFHGRLRDTVARYERDGWAAVVAGDLNVARGAVDGFPGIRLAPAHVRNREDFEDAFMRGPGEGGLGMRDSFRELHGSERKYTYRSPNIAWGASCDRVDLILLTEGLVRGPGALVEADILDELAERGPSDHLPSYVTLDMTGLTT